MLTDSQLASYGRDGFLAVPGFVSEAACRELVERADDLVAGFEGDTVSIFSTHEQTRTSDEYFLDSGDKVRFFFEEDGRHLNKIGHALHDLDPVFERFSRAPAIAEVAGDLGYEQPLLLQSMYIFKSAHVGGEVTAHQDHTFLWTEPASVTGLWFALQDATVANGCLWALPGGHRLGVGKRFKRAAGGGTEFEVLDAEPLPEDGYVPIEASTGTLVVLHGHLPHRSGPNSSGTSREAYSIHLIDGRARYLDDNWLQRAEPPRGF